MRSQYNSVLQTEKLINFESNLLLLFYATRDFRLITIFILWATSLEHMSHKVLNELKLTFGKQREKKECSSKSTLYLFHFSCYFDSVRVIEKKNVFN